MKEYRFLLKPAFFIFSLLFATWLIIKIEKISPSDFGDGASEAVPPLVNSAVDRDDKSYLMELCFSFKAGRIDTAELNERLSLFLASRSSK